MGARGPTPAPTALKLAKGDRRIPKDEPTPPPGEAHPPASITAEEREHWDRLAPILTAMGVLTTADADALYSLCKLMAEEAALEADIRENGRTYRIESSGQIATRPEVKWLSHTREKIDRARKEFGLTPASRARVKAVKPDKPAAAQDPKAAFWVKGA